MRRVVSSILLACGLSAASLGLVGVSLVLAPTPVAAAGKKVCTISDERLVELSGLVATDDGYIVINDGTEVASRERVFYLDSKCKVTKTVQYGGNGPRDPEDLAVSPDGQTLWIADTGDNVTSENRRDSVALWSMPISGESRPVLHRLAYPQGKAQDAEALLIGDDGTPYVITKTIGKAEIYRPTGPLRQNNSDPVPMEKVGEISLPATTTANRFGPAGRVTITGAARSPDGKRVVLRTYADAFEWDVPDGDIVKALTTGRPRVTPLADPFGEAIAYTPDGTTFLTVSDVGSLNEDVDVTILSYVPTKQQATAGVAAGGGQGQGDDEGSWLDGLTLDHITYLIAGVGVLGVLLVAVGVTGILMSRRRSARGQGASPEDNAESDAERPSARSAPVASVSVRSAPAGAGPARGTTYGAPAAGPARPRSGAVYGGGGGSGAVYGGTGGHGPQGAVYGGGAAGPAPRGGRPERGMRPERGGRPDRGGPGGGYGGPGPYGGSGVYGGNGAYGGPPGEGQAPPRAGRPHRGYPGDPGQARHRGGPPMEPRHFDNDYGYR